MLQADIAIYSGLHWPHGLHPHFQVCLSGHGASFTELKVFTSRIRQIWLPVDYEFTHRKFHTPLVQVSYISNFLPNQYDSQSHSAESSCKLLESRWVSVQRTFARSLSHRHTFGPLVTREGTTRRRTYLGLDATLLKAGSGNVKGRLCVAPTRRNLH